MYKIYSVFPGNDTMHVIIADGNNTVIRSKIFSAERHSFERAAAVLLEDIAKEKGE